MRYQGRITTWKDEKGFGFITPMDGGEQVFVHISSFSNRRRRPNGEEFVSYELTRDAKGRAQANAVAYVGDWDMPSAPRGRSSIPPILSVCFLVFVVVVVVAGRYPSLYLRSTL
ncbi:MAG: cold shock domain-containing protein [Betaproteobacteria bacterium]|nr:cold shock domain-containing protein [Betaproteobacteria bacterium]